MAQSNPRPSSASKRTRNVTLVVAATAVVILVAVVWKLSGNGPTGPERSSRPFTTDRSSRAPEAHDAEVDLQRLVGDWRRPDGGYVLRVRSVAADGTVDAAYLNPKPVGISMARASSLQGSATLFVEFDDVNYRGSTYELVHVPDRNILHGSYFQAALGQTFEVVFVPIE
jgi:hypothetical protein